MINPKDGHRCQRMTRARVVMVPHAGHLPFADQPDVFLHHVCDFLDSIRINKSFAL